MRKNLDTIKIEDASQLHDGIFDANSNTIFYFGDLIRDLRTEQKLSQQIVCQGLCSKSKLSKIENNYLQPDIALAEALLQRLGLSERVFTFWGTEKDLTLHKIKFRLLHLNLYKETLREKYFNKIETVVDNKNILHKQYYFLQKLPFIENLQEKIETAETALHLTLPNLTFENIDSYCLSWNELSILNLISYTLDNTQRSYNNTLNFSYILNYGKRHILDIIFQNQFYPVTVSHFIRSLYLQKHFQEVLEYKNLFLHPTLYHSIFFYGLCLGYYCQSLGECQQINDAETYAYYSVALENIAGYHTNANALIQFMKEDFDISIQL